MEKQNKKLTNKLLLAILCLLLLFVVALISYSSMEKENKSYKKIIYYEAAFNELEAGDLAAEKYSTATEYFDIWEDDLVISNCERSRDYSNDYMQDLRELIYELKEEESEILKVFLKMVYEEKEIYLNLYEACEYLESTSRAYKEDNYISGDINLEAHNEKIEAHDNAVERYNENLAEYNSLKKELSK